MFDMIRTRRESEKKEERHDLFSQLLDASEAETEDGLPQITDRELVGMLTLPLYTFYAGLPSLARQYLHISPCRGFLLSFSYPYTYPADRYCSSIGPRGQSKRFILYLRMKP